MASIKLDSVKKELRFCNANIVNPVGLSDDYLAVVRQCRSKSNANICVRGIGGAKTESLEQKRIAGVVRPDNIKNHRRII